ncbi:hypothetical protein [Nocardioides yefusunii]|uniref:DUF222 domain-containing protein n=1 Tax=Nocardioides yefusunii TaxID=2500546 RepID=A0ABW1QZC1_9ACTN|nr:hypothetical protein [Nocardioides yefusunii]
MSETLSLRDRAKQLGAKARAKQENMADVVAAGQFETALEKLTSMYSPLRSALHTHQKLRSAGIPMPDVTGLEAPLTKLEEEASISRPTPQFLASRRKDISTLTTSVQALTDQAWRTWAATQIAELAVDPSLVVGTRGQRFTLKVDDLKSMAKKSAAEAFIPEFKSWLGTAADLRDHLSSPMTAEDVFDRIKATPGFSFSDFTTEELEVLQHDLDAAQRIRITLL